VTVETFVPETMAAISHLETIYGNDGSVRLSVEPVAGGVVAFVRPSAAFSWVEGQEVPIAALESQSTYVTKGSFAHTFPAVSPGDVLDVAVVTLYGDLAVVGARARIVGTAPVPRITLERLGPLVRVGVPWDQLQGASRVALGWSFERRRPVSIEDTPSEQRAILQKNRPFEGIRTAGSGVCHVVAAPIAALSGADAYGPPTWAFIEMTGRA